MKSKECIELIKQVSFIKCQNIIDQIIMLGHHTYSYIYCVKTFGIDSEITQDVLKSFDEIKKIIQEENDILKFICKNSKDIEYLQAEIFIGLLDILHDETMRYYYYGLSEKNDACMMKQDWRGKRPIKRFNTLIETDSYWKEAFSLTLTVDDIVDFLEFPEEFIDFLANKIIFLDDPFEEEKGLYGIHLLGETYLEDIRVVIPIVWNIDTAKINIHIFRQAYELYKKLGQPIDFLGDFKTETNDSKKQFTDKYLKQKIKTIR